MGVPGGQDYTAINQAGEAAYYRLTGVHSGIPEDDQFIHVIQRGHHFLKKFFNDTFKAPANSSQNDSLVMYLKRIVADFEQLTGAIAVAKPDNQVLQYVAAQNNDPNHVDSLLLIDTLLQLAYMQENNGSTLPPGDSLRPVYNAGYGSDLDYFQAYLNSVANV